MSSLLGGMLPSVMCQSVGPLGDVGAGMLGEVSLEP